MPLHPDLEALLDMVEIATATGKRPLIHQLTPEQARREFDQASAALDLPPVPLPRVEALLIPTRDGARIDARLYAPEPRGAGGLLPVLLHFHSGGFTVGSLDSHAALCSALASRTPCAVLSVAYRLAPEHRFPTAANDAVDALAWLGAHAHALGLDPNRIAVGGDSAGGTLSAMLALAARDDPALPQPCLQILCYAGLSGRTDTDSHRRYGEGYLLDTVTIEWFYAQTLRNEADRTDWRFAPLLAPDHRGVAPALVVLAECDPLYDEGLAYATRLADAGVEVSVLEYAGMVHEFLRMGNIVDDAQLAHGDIAQALARRFAALGVGTEAFGRAA
ncbi:alpha/beta hydrolase [Cupriavidus sp. AU9028]|uniref:alpha/beta hydrolase n=1 Tax=Cupriavidus sp. AU9028 TaxID=2871157 RepID=UPI001C964F44|nr:alpha/beta hydrolase [Cupriavidus sp. AU9028]MBY4899193.1 alpha/beta hydrolase [Cupriavidus sp. AU9028]